MKQSWNDARLECLNAYKYISTCTTKVEHSIFPTRMYTKSTMWPRSLFVSSTSAVNKLSEASLIFVPGKGRLAIQPESLRGVQQTSRTHLRGVCVHLGGQVCSGREIRDHARTGGYFTQSLSSYLAGHLTESDALQSISEPGSERLWLVQQGFR